MNEERNEPPSRSAWNTEVSINAPFPSLVLEGGSQTRSLCAWNLVGLNEHV